MGLPVEFLKLQQFLKSELAEVQLWLRFNRPAVRPTRFNSLRCV